jgi:hypothetical protein
LEKISALRIKEEGPEEESAVVVAITDVSVSGGGSTVCTQRDDIFSIKFSHARLAIRYKRRQKLMELMVGMDPELSSSTLIPEGGGGGGGEPPASHPWSPDDLEGEPANN